MLYPLKHLVSKKTEGKNQIAKMNIFLKIYNINYVTKNTREIQEIELNCTKFCWLLLLLLFMQQKVSMKIALCHFRMLYPAFHRWGQHVQHTAVLCDVLCCCCYTEWNALDKKWKHDPSVCVADKLRRLKVVFYNFGSFFFKICLQRSQRCANCAQAKVVLNSFSQNQHRNINA